MSVVVRMEMPKDCWDCPFVNGEFGYCQVDKEERQIEDTYGRPSWCPIICSLPEGHGRLVDADAILKKSNGKYGDFEITAVAMEFYGSPIIVPAEAERSKT